MKDLHTLGAEEEGLLISRLAQCADAKSAGDEAIRWLDQVGAAYAEQAMPAAQRAKALGLLGVGKAALEALGAVDRAQVSSGPLLSPPQPRWRLALGYLPSLLAGLSALWALLLEHNALCLLCALGGGLALPVLRPALTALTGEMRRAPEARPQAAPEQLARRLLYLLGEIDGQLEREQPAPEEGPRLGAPLLEAAQMLLEAQLTGDAQYALKGVSPLADALTRQGIELVLYAPDRAQDFDLLPAPVGGRTLRPALRQGGALLLRGQATVKR